MIFIVNYILILRNIYNYREFGEIDNFDTKSKPHSMLRFLMQISPTLKIPIK